MILHVFPDGSWEWVNRFEVFDGHIQFWYNSRQKMIESDPYPPDDGPYAFNIVYKNHKYQVVPFVLSEETWARAIVYSQLLDGLVLAKTLRFLCG